MIFFKAKENEIGNVQHVTSQLVVYSSVDGFYVTQRKKMYTVWSSDLYTLLMRYEVNLTPYRIKSVYKWLDQTVGGALEKIQ